MAKQPGYSLLNNSRFYVLSTTVCLSLLIYFAMFITVVDTRLRGIRLQQIYGLCAITYWYIVLLMSPVSKLLGQRKWLPYVLFLRRPLGVGVAYFALLHFLIGFFGQLGGWHGIWLLPTAFLVALCFGFTALLVLLVMAALSVDGLVKATHFKQWKWLGRISYLAGILVIVHIWIIGTHASSLLLQFIGFQALAVLFGLEAAKFGKGLMAKKVSTAKAVTYAIILWLVLTGGLLAMKAYVPSYGNNHAEHLQTGTAGHAH